MPELIAKLHKTIIFFVNKNKIELNKKTTLLLNSNVIPLMFHVLIRSFERIFFA
jgi:hypothetical protein